MQSWLPSGGQAHSPADLHKQGVDSDSGTAAAGADGPDVHSLRREVGLPCDVNDSPILRGLNAYSLCRSLWGLMHTLLCQSLATATFSKILQLGSGFAGCTAAGAAAACGDNCTASAPPTHGSAGGQRYHQQTGRR